MVEFQCARHEGIFGNGATTPLILNFFVRWRRVLSFVNRPLYPVECAPANYSVRAANPQGWTRTEEEKIIYCLQQEFNHSRLVAHRKSKSLKYPKKRNK